MPVHLAFISLPPRDYAKAFGWSSLLARRRDLSVSMSNAPLFFICLPLVFSSAQCKPKASIYYKQVISYFQLELFMRYVPIKRDTLIAYVIEAGEI